MNVQVCPLKLKDHTAPIVAQTWADNWMLCVNVDPFDQGLGIETIWRGRIKGATKAKSECTRFPLTLTLTLCDHIKGAPDLDCRSGLCF